ncbi:MAG: MoxR family ATPase [Planctomycetota bacterium]
MSELARKLKASIGRVLFGKEDAVELCVTALIAGGHLLIEDQPGVGKTLLARAMARALDLPFQRVQCTSDLLPADLLGSQVYHPSTGELHFREGPVFTSILLADELNRTPPRTQSALLQCMSEGQVTIDRRTFALPRPFFVIATQNPSTAAGTYPLPENQLDRFLMRIEIGYPTPEHERMAVEQEDGHRQASAIAPVATSLDLEQDARAVDRVRFSPELTEYVVEIAAETRRHGDVRTGVSTRGAQALHRACRARAVVRGRDYVVPDDLRALIEPVWAHRMAVRGGRGAAAAVLREILAEKGLPE